MVNKLEVKKVQEILEKDMEKHFNHTFGSNIMDDVIDLSSIRSRIESELENNPNMLCLVCCKDNSLIGFGADNDSLFYNTYDSIQEGVEYFICSQLELEDVVLNEGHKIDFKMLSQAQARLIVGSKYINEGIPSADIQLVPFEPIQKINVKPVFVNDYSKEV